MTKKKSRWKEPSTWAGLSASAIGVAAGITAQPLLLAVPGLSKVLTVAGGVVGTVGVALGGVAVLLRESNGSAP